MILLLDAGNTRLKWGVYDTGAARWLARGALDYSALSALPEVWADSGAPDCAWVVNVAGAKVGAALAACLAHHGVPLCPVTAAAQACGVVNAYREPAQLGADRWAALIGARSIHTGPALVVCAGTATTVDLLDGAGVFQGGMILPGFELMRHSLVQGTAGLPLAQAAVASLPRSTDEAIVAGCVAAQVGAVRQMWRQIGDAPGAICLLSGGAADWLTGQLELPSRVIPDLVLQGLLVLATAAGKPRADC